MVERLLPHALIGTPHAARGASKERIAERGAMPKVRQRVGTEFTQAWALGEALACALGPQLERCPPHLPNYLGMPMSHPDWRPPRGRPAECLEPNLARG